VDFRALNTITRVDAYPLPVFEETMSTLHGSKYFTTLDAYSGYWQIRVAEYKPKTAFSTPGCHFQFTRLPYGLAAGPACFQRLMDVVLKELRGTECWTHMDDVILFSKTIEEHAQRLEHVLQKFEMANLQLQPSKCVFAQSQFQYLGYTVSEEGLTASPDKTSAIRHYTAPKSMKDVRSFLGLASFYRRLVPNFAYMAKPLTELIKKDVAFIWGERQQKAFEKLKEVLCSDTVLAYPDFSKQFVLTTDASKIAVAAILSQVQNGVERSISYGSRQLNQTERNYSASELEVLVLLWSTKHFRSYLYGKNS
jgi:hypothetical protein